VSAANGSVALGRKPIQTVGRAVDVVSAFGFAEAETKAVNLEFRTGAKIVSCKTHGMDLHVMIAGPALSSLTRTDSIPSGRSRSRIGYDGIPNTVAVSK